MLRCAVLDVSGPSAGSSWLGRYRLIAELGHGGMADVYLGLVEGAERANKLLVLKRLRNVEDEDATAMFLDEARIAVRLQHPNVVRTFEVAWENEAFFITMEFLHGPTLQQLRRRAATQGGLPLRFELFILAQTLRGLQYAHELTDVYGAPLRIVHRDFTPQNIIVTHTGVPKILDFGIAKAADSAVQTQAGMYKGKLSYMPPEQLAGKRVDPRADLFAAGVMLYQAITGRTLWEGADSNVIIRRLALCDIPPIKNVKPSVAPELVDLCQRALSPKPETRVASAVEMRRMLEACCRFAGFQVRQEDLANYIDSLFGDERHYHEELIRTQLRNEQLLPPANAAGRVVGLPVLQLGSDTKFRGSTRPPPPPLELDTASGMFPSVDVELTGDYPVPPVRWHRWAMAAVGAVILAGAVLGGRALLTHPRPAPELHEAHAFVRPNAMTPAAARPASGARPAASHTGGRWVAQQSNP